MQYSTRSMQHTRRLRNTAQPMQAPEVELVVRQNGPIAPAVVTSDLQAMRKGQARANWVCIQLFK
jgi:hypothetical protein